MKLHNQLVIGKILTEDEFWVTRKKLLDGGNKRSSSTQRVGCKSAMISDIKSLTDGRTNKVTFKFIRCLLLVLESARVEIAVLLNELAYLKYEAASSNPEAFLLKRCMS